MISLFTGAGGLDYGFEAAGCETCIAVDIDADSCNTLRANRPWPVIAADIHSVSGRDLLSDGGLARGAVDILIGGPPCQPFSKSGYWANGDTRRLDDPRAGTLDAFMRVVAETVPEVFVLENVHGISYSGKEEGFALLSKLTQRINRSHSTQYTLAWQVLNSAEYGVPQVRHRFFLVGHRDGQRFDFPRPTHEAPPENGERRFPFESEPLLPYITAWDAIGWLGPDPGEDLCVHGQWAELLPSIPEGENYLWHTNRRGGLPLFGWRTRYWSFLLKLAKHRPSWTIQAQPGPAIGPFHWTNRLLSVRELAAIQTFPKDIKFVGNRPSVQRQIGNAVPSLLGELLAQEICRQYFGAPPVAEAKLAVRLQRPIPPPEQVQSVPEKYLALVGNHPDHPGEGKGSGKTRREPRAAVASLVLL
ncbi:MAG TPA: DNA cytosine methyltransferase [Chloroflexota bacterium]